MTMKIVLVSRRQITTVNLIADTSLLAVVKNKEESAGDLTNDLDTISKWAYNWKILFSPYPQKPMEEVSFSRENSIHNSSNYLFQQC